VFEFQEGDDSDFSSHVFQTPKIIVQIDLPCILEQLTVVDEIAVMYEIMNPQKHLATIMSR
jgi:hypothetical protein